MANSPTQQSPVRGQTPVPAESVHRVWPRILAIVAFFAAFEGILFHTGLYSSIVEPDSTTGYMELQLRNEIRRPKTNRNQVLAVGHSRMALLPRVVNEETPGTGYTFATIGLGGTTPRIWYYALRAVDPDRPQLRRDRDSRTTTTTSPTAMTTSRSARPTCIICSLAWTCAICWTFRGPITSKKLQWQIVRGMLLKGTIYKRDFLEFLDHPARAHQEGTLFRDAIPPAGITATAA